MQICECEAFDFLGVPDFAPRRNTNRRQRPVARVQWTACLLQTLFERALECVGVGVCLV